MDTSKSAYSFLAKDAKTWEGKIGYRLRTKKLKKTLSQGLLIPINDFEEIRRSVLIEGQDVTELLGVVKWEMPEHGNPMNIRTPGIQQQRFPWFIPKTDEIRIQNLPNVLEHQKDKTFEITEKLDGTSATYFYGGPNKEFGVCSRNIWMKNRNKWYHKLWLRIKSWFKTLETTRINSYWQIAKKYRLDEILPTLDKQYAFQGEIIGEGIQKNPYKLTGQEFYIFNIYDIEKFRYLTSVERITLIDNINQSRDQIQNHTYLKHVPVIDKEIISDHFTSIQDIITYADAKSSINPKVDREGIIFKREDGEFSFKAISNKYLLKEE